VKVEDLLTEIKVYPEWLTVDARQNLQHLFERKYDTVKMRGNYMKRTKAWMSDRRVDQDGNTLVPDYKFPGSEQMPDQEPWDPAVEHLRELIHKQFGKRTNQAILTFYTADSAISAHQDKHSNSEFWIVSLGYPRTLEISELGSGRIVQGLPMLDRSLVYVSKRVNDTYKHGFAALSVKPSEHNTRISIVFRELTEWVIQ
jgi:alkylated DNA repair dioxygenase AlkB